MLLSTININRCGRWQKIRLIFNAIGCCNFGTIPAVGTRPNCSNVLVLKSCGCIHPITSSHLQLHNFNQTAAISSTTKSLTKEATTAGNEQQPKPSKPIEINESQQQTKSSPETTEEEQQKQPQNDGNERIDEMPTMPEWATQEGQQESNEESEQTKGLIKADQALPLNLAKTSIIIGQNRKLEIQCRQGSSGQKFIRISMAIPKESTTIYWNLPKIRVPHEAYKFLEATDLLIGQLPVDAPTNRPEANTSRRPILARQMVVEHDHNQRYGFILSVVWHQKDVQWHCYIRSVQTVQEHKPKEVDFPLWALPQLRQQMATILTENDGSVRIDDMPTVPEWAIQANVEDWDAENKEGDEHSESGPNERAVPEQQKAIEMQTERDKTKTLELAKSRLPLIRPNQQLYIHCEQGQSGQKTIQIYILSEQKLKLPGAMQIEIRVPKIRIPQEAYKFVAAMDRLIGHLPVEAPANPKAADKSQPILANQMVEGGKFYDFQLSVVWFEQGRQWVLKIRSVKTVQEHKEKRVQIPLWTLPLLRQKMAIFLEQLDGTERIEKMPTMPEWATLAPNMRLQSRYSN